MFHCRNIENRINRIHERALSVAYDDFRNLSFEKLPIKNNIVSLHQRFFKFSLQKYSKQEISPEIISDSIP